jgi:hypothetical protein
MIAADAAAGAAPAAPAAPGVSAMFRGVPTGEAIEILRREVKAGATGFGETAGLVQVDGPELRRLYALAAELDVAILMHFQEGVAPGLPRYGVSGFSRIEAMLKQFPKTRFICHASDFWGHIDREYKDGGTFPTANKVNPGGLADKLLADYPNMYGDLSAPSGYLQLSRDLDFTAGFLARHQSKLVFGSDCGCADGRGGRAAAPGTTGAAGPARPTTTPGTQASAANMGMNAAAAGGLGGKCVARELLGVVWKTTPRNVFRKLAFDNGVRIYKLRA